MQPFSGYLMAAKILRISRLFGLWLAVFLPVAMASPQPILDHKKGGSVAFALPGLPPGAQLALIPDGPYQRTKVVLPTPVLALVNQGGYAFVAAGEGGLQIFDLAAQAPQHVSGQIKGQGNITHLALRDDFAYLADSAGALLIVNIADPQRPQQVARVALKQPPDALCVDRGRVYLVSGKQLTILDVSVPGAPRLLVNHELAGAAKSVQVVEGYAYLAARQAGLKILDVHDPLHPREAGNFRGEVQDVAVADGRAYLANGATGLTVLDVSQPQTPRWLGSVNHLGEVSSLSYGEGYVAVRNGRDELMLIDVHQPKLPRLVASYRSGYALNAISTVAVELIPAAPAPAQRLVLAATSRGFETIDFSALVPNVVNLGANFGGSRRAVIRDNILFVADWFSGLHLYDISQPESPRHLSNFHTQGSSKGVLVRGDYAFVADDDHGVQILDIKNPQQPRKISEVATPGLAYTMKLVGDYLYLADHRGGFHIISVADIAHPAIIGSASIAGKAWAVEIVDQLAYVAADNAGLLVFDISDPTQPKQLTAYEVGGAAEDVVIRGHFAYVASFDNGLHIFDISQPLQARELSHLSTPGNLRGIELVDNLAYLADWVAGIQVVNIADPAHPVTLGTFDTAGWSWGVRVQGHYAYVLDWWGGLTVLDISDSATPIFAGAYQARGLTQDVAVRDGYALVADGSNGLQIFDVNNPLNPIWMSGVDMAGDAQSIWLEKNTAYLATGNSGIARVDITNPFQPQLLKQWAVDSPVEIPANNSRLDGNGTETADVLKVALVRAQDKLVYAVDRRHGIAILDAESGHQIAWYKAIVEDIWPAKNRLLLAAQSGVQIVDMNNLKRMHLLKQLKQPATLVRLKNNLLVLYHPASGFSLYDYARLKLLSRFNPGEEIADFTISGKQLYATGKLSGLLQLDISNARQPLLKAAYPAAARVTKLAVSSGAVFMAGNDTLTEVKLLPTILVRKENNGSISVTAPGDMPLGGYQILALDSKTGTRRYYPEALRVVMPASKKPRFTLQDLERAMRERGLNPALHQ
jgi:hypothetical protein